MDKRLYPILAEMDHGLFRLFNKRSNVSPLRNRLRLRPLGNLPQGAIALIILLSSCLDFGYLFQTKFFDQLFA
jgi:hypothetical protein